jgi:clan AA aspartic protease
VAVIGRVDGHLRALIRVPVGALRDGPRQEVEAWVDTAFNGGLTVSRSLVAGLGLPQEASTEAVLADGRTVTVEMFGCYIDWFGGTFQTQAVAGDAVYPLLGTQLLAGRRLTIDYATGTVELT